MGAGGGVAERCVYGGGVGAGGVVVVVVNIVFGIKCVSSSGCLRDRHAL